MRFSRKCGAYQLSLFTAPAQLRAGAVDFSVLLQDQAGRALADEGAVTIVATLVASPHRSVSGVASAEGATNKLMRAVSLPLTEAGRWRVAVEFVRSAEVASVATEIEVGPPPPPWAELGPWIGWPAAAAALFVIHQELVRRRGQPR